MNVCRRCTVKANTYDDLSAEKVGLMGLENGGLDRLSTNYVEKIYEVFW
jgi:hypothetical protein